MRVRKTIRIYKRNDYDLFCIHAAGYNVAWMIHDTVQALLKGNGVRIRLNEECKKADSGTTSVRLEVSFDDPDGKIDELFKSIKTGYASNFCKAVLRSSLCVQNILCFTDMPLQVNALEKTDGVVIPVERYKRERRSKLLESFGVDKMIKDSSNPPPVQNTPSNTPPEAELPVTATIPPVESTPKKPAKDETQKEKPHQADDKTEKKIISQSNEKGGGDDLMKMFDAL